MQDFSNSYFPSVEVINCLHPSIASYILEGKYDTQI